MKYPKCHFENPDDTTYCGKCATLLKSSKDIAISRTKTILKSSSELPIGYIFSGRYKIIEELGRGVVVTFRRGRLIQ